MAKNLTDYFDVAVIFLKRELTSEHFKKANSNNCSCNIAHILSAPIGIGTIAQ